MESVDFKKDLETKNGIALDDNYILFKDYELYNQDTEESVYFKTFDEVLDCKINDETIRSIIEKTDTTAPIDEGGGKTSIKRGGSLFGGKGSRSGGRGSGKAEKINTLPPAYINNLTSPRFKSVDKTAKAYGRNFLEADREYGGLIDENGFAEKYVKGQSTSVTHLERAGAYSIHNHPVKHLMAKNKKVPGYIAYNAPSTPDIRNWALGNGKGTIVVSSGNRTMYKLTKNQHFDAKGFIKAMKKAKSTGAKNYDKDVDAFLRANQKNYGYKYNRNKF